MPEELGSWILNCTRYVVEGLIGSTVTFKMLEENVHGVIDPFTLHSSDDEEENADDNEIEMYPVADIEDVVL
jgi:hypothetical protein